MHSVCARAACNGEELVDHEVGVRARSAVKRVCLVGKFDVPRIPILIGVHRHRGDAAIFRSANNANCNFPPVCDQNLGDASHSHLAYCAPEPLNLATSYKMNGSGCACLYNRPLEVHSLTSPHCGPTDSEVAQQKAERRHREADDCVRISVDGFDKR